MQRLVLTARLGAISCIAAIAAGCAWANAAYSTAGDGDSIYILLAFSVFGILAALAGLVSSYGHGRSSSPLERERRSVQRQSVAACAKRSR